MIVTDAILLLCRPWKSDSDRSRAPSRQEQVRDSCLQTGAGALTNSACRQVGARRQVGACRQVQAPSRAKRGTGASRLWLSVTLFCFRRSARFDSWYAMFLRVGRGEGS